MTGIFCWAGLSVTPPSPHYDAKFGNVHIGGKKSFTWNSYSPFQYNDMMLLLFCIHDRVLVTVLLQEYLASCLMHCTCMKKSVCTSHIAGLVMAGSSLVTCSSSFTSWFASLKEKNTRALEKNPLFIFYQSCRFFFCLVCL